MYSADSAARRERKPHPYDGIISSAYWLLIPNLNLYSRWNKRFYPPAGGASRAPGLPRAAADTISGQKPGPTVSAENKKAAVHCRTRNKIPPCYPCAALCEAIRCRTPCTNKPVRSRCAGPVGERREQKVSAQRTPYFLFLKRILIPRKIFFCPSFCPFRWNQGRSNLVRG